MIEIPLKFPGKREGDKVVFFVHKHWIKYVVTSIVTILLLSIPIIAIILYLQNNLGHNLLSAEIITIGIGIYLLIVMAIIIQAFVDFYLDIFVATEDRVIFVRQNGFFNQQIDVAHIWDIDEVGVDVKGFLNSVLDCGDLVIHMGNDEAILTVNDIKNPNKIGQEIMRLQKEHVESGGLRKKEIEEDQVEEKDAKKE